jgi:hypothetical protein
MKKIGILILFSLIFKKSFSQEVLPDITVKNYNGKIIVSWLNDYKIPIQNILIQRSFDSLKNYSTIGTVLNPQNLENGYPNNNPPYNKMYYRLTILFNGGKYEISRSHRPIKEIIPMAPMDITAIPKTAIEIPIVHTVIDSALKIIVDSVKKESFRIKKDSSSKLTGIKTIIKPERIIETPYPSLRIYTSKQNTVNIQIPDAKINNYSVRFYDENNKLIFQIKKIREELLYIEKYNFIHSGWFYFEIYENGELFEKNKFFIARDKPKPNN